MASVTFKDYNGTVLKTETVEEGGSATPPSYPIRDGYLCIGWDNYNYTNITSDLDITAQYIQEKGTSSNNILPSFKNQNGTILGNTTLIQKNDYSMSISIIADGISGIDFPYPEEWKGKDVTFSIGNISSNAQFNISNLVLTSSNKSGTVNVPAGNNATMGLYIIGTSGTSAVHWVTDVQAFPIYTITASANTGGSITPSGATTVSEGSSQTYTISADSGYKIKDVKVDGVSQGAITTYTFDNVTSGHTIEATFAPVISRQVILTPAAVDLTASEYKDESSPFTNAIGKGSDNEGNYAEWGLVTGRQAFTRVYWSFDISSIPSNATITNVTCSARCSNTNANAMQGGNTLIAIGTVINGNEWTNKVASDNASFGTSPTVVTVSDATFTRAELDNFRLKIQAVRGFLSTNTSYHTKFYGATLTINYEVEAIPYTITASAGTGGTISPNGSTNVYEGRSQVYTISANTGYRIKSVTVDGVDQGPVTTYTFSNVTANHNIQAVFEAIATYTITASSNAGGSISPDGETTVLENGSQSYSISANTGYGIKDILVDGVSQGAITSYTFTNVNSNHTIEVVFESVPTVIAAIKNNVFYAINIFEGYSEFSIGPDGVYLNAIAKDLNENESIYLDSNYTLHVFNFIKEDL